MREIYDKHKVPFEDEAHQRVMDETHQFVLDQLNAITVLEQKLNECKPTPKVQPNDLSKEEF